MHQPDPLLVTVQRRPVGEPGGGGGHGGDDPGRDEGRRGALGAPAAAQVEQHRRGPAAERDPDQGRMSGLPERHAVQRVGPPAGGRARTTKPDSAPTGRSRACARSMRSATVAGLAERGAARACPPRLVTGELPHNLEAYPGEPSVIT